MTVSGDLLPDEMTLRLRLSNVYGYTSEAYLLLCIIRLIFLKKSLTIENFVYSILKLDAFP